MRKTFRSISCAEPCQCCWSISLRCSGHHLSFRSTHPRQSRGISSSHFSRVHRARRCDSMACLCLCVYLIVTLDMQLSPRAQVIAARGTVYTVYLSLPVVKSFNFSLRFYGFFVGHCQPFPAETQSTSGWLAVLCSEEEGTRTMLLTLSLLERLVL